MSSSSIKHRKECFYCGAMLSNGIGTQLDHFPIPNSEGGTETVPSCLSCHDMKDRFHLADWPIDWYAKVIEDFPKLSRETRICFAKIIRIVEQSKSKKPRQAQGRRDETADTLRDGRAESRIT